MPCGTARKEYLSLLGGQTAFAVSPNTGRLHPRYIPRPGRRVRPSSTRWKRAAKWTSPIERIPGTQQTPPRVSERCPPQLPAFARRDSHIARRPSSELPYRRPGDGRPLLGYEGLVGKDEASPYREGRTLSWLKVKLPNHRVGERGWEPQKW